MAKTTQTKSAQTRATQKLVRRINWRLWLGVVMVVAAGVSTAMASHQMWRFMTTDPQFKLSRQRRDSFDLQGLRYTSRAKVQRVFTNDFDRSVFAVPLDERRRRLLAIDWVEDASVSRVWPDRLVVRLQERKPVAFVYFRSGVLLIDRQGVLLEPPPQARFLFPVLSGITDDQTERQRYDRVSAMMQLLDELGPGAKDISEVNAADPDSLRLIVQMDGKAVELLIGDTNYARRFQNFVSHYAEMQKRSPDVKLFDLRLDDRILAKE